MEVLQFETRDALDKACAEAISGLIRQQPGLLFCAATGSSPAGVYQRLVELAGSSPAGVYQQLAGSAGSSSTGAYQQSRKAGLDISALRVVKLDEWAGLPMEHYGSCESYLRQHLIRPFSIRPENYLSFNSQAESPQAECSRISTELESWGTIDLCILGIGLNGHIAFNEPASVLQRGVHLATLTETSQAHPMVNGADYPLKFGYTLGMEAIMQSRKIMLIIQGPHKKAIFQELMAGTISTFLPASLLWLHANASCYYCEN